MPESPQLPPLDKRHADALGGDAILDEGVIHSLLELGGADGIELLVELIDLFIDDSAERVRNLRIACERGEADGAARAAHALKSASANIGALGLSKFCRRLEADAKAASPIADTVAKVEEMHTVVCESLNELRKRCSA